MNATAYERLKRRLMAAQVRHIDPAPPPCERLAVISCIHSNLPALATVMEFLAAEYGIGPDRVICLGDIVGYGPDPVECIDIAREFRLCMMGNHDEAVVHGPFGFGAAARRAVLWTTKLLRPRLFSSRVVRARWEFMEQLVVPMQRIGDWQFVHGSPRDPTMEYILKVDTEVYFGEIPPKIRESFAMIHRVLFVGHSHVPGLITEDNRYFTADELTHEYELQPGRKVIVNVGSVGQPRDQDPRACVVVADEATRVFRWHRLPYDIDSTARRILANPKLDDRNAGRMYRGL